MMVAGTTSVGLLLAAMSMGGVSAFLPMAPRLRPRTTALASYLDTLQAPPATAGCPHAAAAAAAAVASPPPAAYEDPSVYGPVREELKMLMNVRGGRAG